MTDRIFADPRLAVLYDLLSPWGEPDDQFYLPLVMAAESVLDLGCGTGQLLIAAREAGHAGRLCGLDPAAAMLDVARERSDIEWIHGDLTSVHFDREFELVVMTGHAFQVFLTDDQLHHALAAIRAALANDGRFVFETRNPQARAWESWTPDRVREIITSDGDVVRVSHDAHTTVTDDIVSFTSTFSSPAWNEPLLSDSTLRFLDVDTLHSFLANAGFRIEGQYGDWDRSPLSSASPEIITIVRPS